MGFKKSKKDVAQGTGDVEDFQNVITGKQKELEDLKAETQDPETIKKQLIETTEQLQAAADARRNKPRACRHDPKRSLRRRSIPRRCCSGR